MKKQMTFMQACRDYFGMHPGQTSVQFGTEIKALNEKDRAEITQGLKAQGYEIITPQPVKV